MTKLERWLLPVAFAFMLLAATTDKSEAVEPMASPGTPIALLNGEPMILIYRAICQGYPWMFPITHSGELEMLQKLLLGQVHPQEFVAFVVALNHEEIKDDPEVMMAIQMSAQMCHNAMAST